MARSSHLLRLIVDCNACWWGELAESSEDNAVASMICSLAAFCNAHSAQNAANRLLVLGAAHGLSSSLIYSTYSAKPSDDPCATIIAGVQRCLQESASSSTSSKECPLAGPLATALCHINCTRKEERQQSEGRTARILVLKVSDDTTTQHMRLMNIFFAAQKQTVALDVCAVRQSSATMQQAADITGGIYVRVDRPAGLLQYLLTVFLPDPSLRPKLVLPASGDVDYRPACRCHQKLISVGWVCSVCLTVLCQFTPICLTCQTVFKVPILAKPTKKRKRNI